MEMSGRGKTCVISPRRLARHIETGESFCAIVGVVKQVSVHS